MLSTAIPPRFPIPFANGAGGSFIRSIPRNSQIGVQAGAASLNDGFPPDTMQPPASGGTPPFGQDFNGLLKQITQWAQWQATGAPVTYDATFATAIGGYPFGSKLASTVTAGVIWVSSADNNLTDPDGGSPAGWTRTLAHDFSPIGYRIGADGFIDQWGGVSNVSGDGGGTLITFPIPFPNECLGMVGSNAAGGPPTAFVGVEIISATQGRVWSSSSSGVASLPGTSSRWRAWGW